MLITHWNTYVTASVQVQHECSTNNIDRVMDGWISKMSRPRQRIPKNRPGLATARSRVRIPLRNFGNSVYPALPVSFGGDTKSRRSLLSGVYARGSKSPHQSALECVTVVDSTAHSKLPHKCVYAPENAALYWKRRIYLHGGRHLPRPASMWGFQLHSRANWVTLTL